MSIEQRTVLIAFGVICLYLGFTVKGFRTKAVCTFASAAAAALAALMYPPLGIFLASMLIIAKGADWFTESSVSIAEATRVPRVVIGATMVSIATTMPEFSVSCIATLQGKMGVREGQLSMAVGNAIGSCICNIGLILGSCVLIRSMVVRRDLLVQQGLFMVGAGALLGFFGLNGHLSRFDGMMLLLCFVGYVAYSLLTARRERAKCLVEKEVREFEDIEQIDVAAISLKRELAFFVLGAACVVLGAKGLVDSGERIALDIGIPPVIIALTLVALGTSLPEYITALTATVKGYQDLSVGNIMGANILNIFWVLGACSVIAELPIKREPTQILDIPLMLLLMTLFLALGMTKSKLEKWEGGVMLGVYAAYLAILFTVFSAVAGASE